METKLSRIAEAAKKRPNEKFTSLIHLINEEMLKICHEEMPKGKATGIDEVTKEEYGKNLDENVRNLIERMKRQSYKPQPVKRVYIPKPGTDKKRPIGIQAYEDKLIQAGMAKILNAIYEQDFIDCSFGFRPGRSSHDAIKLLDKIVNKLEIQYIVDVDIRSFFDNIDHEWLMKFLEHRIKDTNILRLAKRFLKAGIVEAGIRYDTPEGTAQGGVVSPIFGNVYLHYALDLWFEKKIRGKMRGTAYMVRYADDTVFCFEYMEDARDFYLMLIDRLRKFNLEIAEEKTKIVRLDKNKKNSDVDSTFDFLGFTHYVGKSRNGKTRVKRKTSKKKFKSGLLKVKDWIIKNRTVATKEFMKKIKSKLQGHIQYYGITDNIPSVSKFFYEVRRLLYKWMNRRSQRKSFNWDKFNLFLEKYPFPKIKTYKCVFGKGAGDKYL